MFFKKVRGALLVCIWNQGGGGPKKFGNRCCRVQVTGWPKDSLKLATKKCLLQRTQPVGTSLSPVAWFMLLVIRDGPWLLDSFFSQWLDSPLGA
jgi:hypothetical protein